MFDPDDDDAFAELVAATHRQVRAHIAGMGVPWNDVDDLAQEVFLAHYARQDERPPGVAVVAWLKGVARNKVLHYWRRRGHAAAFLEEVGDHLAEAPGVADEPLGLEALQRCLADLPEDARRLVRWHYADELTSAAIAERLDRPASTVRMHLVRIRDLLRECVRRRQPS